MCKTCGCTPCKCGAIIVNGVCEGCGKTYDDCTCEKKQILSQTTKASLKNKRTVGNGFISKLPLFVFFLFAAGFGLICTEYLDSWKKSEQNCTLR